MPSIDTFEKNFKREWEEITDFLNPRKPSIPDDGMLTYLKENGEIGIRGYNIKDVPKELYGVISKLRAYEDTGYQPEDLLPFMDKKTVQAAVKSENEKEIKRLKRLRVQYVNRQQALLEAGKFYMSNKNAQKVKEIDIRIRELQREGLLFN